MLDPRRDRVRRLSLFDLIIVVAAVAVWLAVTRFYAERSNMVSIWYLGDHGIVRIFQNQGGYFLILASLTMLVIRLRGPRPTWRRLWRQPGLAASAGAVVGIFIGALESSAATAGSLDPTRWTILSLFNRARPCVAPGVIGAWLGLILSGRWRPERGAIDRMGRLAGWLWLVEFIIAEMPTTRWFRIIDNLIRRGLR